MWWTREGSYDNVENAYYHSGCQGGCYTCVDQDDTYRSEDGPWIPGWDGNESWHYTYYYGSWPGPHRAVGSWSPFDVNAQSEIWVNQMKVGSLEAVVYWSPRP